MGRKKVVVLRPFHEVAFETLEKGKESEGYKRLDEWVGYGHDMLLAIASLLTQCVVPEKEHLRIVPALIAASKGAGPDHYGDVNKAAAFALKHFMPGKRGLKELGKLLSAEYLASEEYSDEADGLEDLLQTLGLKVPERPKKEEAKKPPAEKAAGKKAGKAQAKGGGKPKQKLTK